MDELGHGRRAPDDAASRDRRKGWFFPKHPRIGDVAGVLLILALVYHVYRSQTPPEWIERANRVRCASNLRIIGKSLTVYRDEHHVYPPRLELLVATAEPDLSIFVCPSSTDTPLRLGSPPTTQPLFGHGHCSYVYVGASLTMNASPDAVLVYEPLSNHGGNGINALYNDGHVEWMNAADGKYLISELRAGHNPPRARNSAVTKPAGSGR